MGFKTDAVQGTNNANLVNRNQDIAAQQTTLKPEKKVKGEFPGKSVVLTVADDQPGYDSFKIHDARLMEKVYVAFLRLYETETGAVGIHWHLSPLSEGLMKGMNEILERGHRRVNTKEVNRLSGPLLKRASSADNPKRERIVSEEGK